MSLGFFWCRCIIPPNYSTISLASNYELRKKLFRTNIQSKRQPAPPMETIEESPSTSFEVIDALLEHTFENGKYDFEWSGEYDGQHPEWLEK